MTTIDPESLAGKRVSWSGFSAVEKDTVEMTGTIVSVAVGWEGDDDPICRLALDEPAHARNADTYEQPLSRLTIIPELPATIAEFAVALIELADLEERDPIEAARRCKAYIEHAAALLSARRHRAIFKATRNLSYRAVAQQLGCRVDAINAAVTKYNTAVRRGETQP